jgi:hypothetical protein
MNINKERDMQQSQFEVAILKPTSVFYSFLASQLPESKLPDIELLQKDTTAYLIKRFANEELTLDEIERHYPQMFSHEIKRWLGDDAYNEIQESFLDFLCCFKFELHNQIVLMESSLQQAKQLLRIKPRSILLRWMKDSVEEQSDLGDILEQVSINQVAENGTVVLKNFKSLAEIKPFLMKNYQTIFKTEMSRMCEQASLWPNVECFNDFKKYFTVEIHTQLIQLNGR